MTDITGGVCAGASAIRGRRKYRRVIGLGSEPHSNYAVVTATGLRRTWRPEATTFV